MIGSQKIGWSNPSEKWSFESWRSQIVMILHFPFTATDITIKAIVSDSASGGFSLVWHMRTHGSEPFEGIIREQWKKSV